MLGYHYLFYKIYTNISIKFFHLYYMPSNKVISSLLEKILHYTKSEEQANHVTHMLELSAKELIIINNDKGSNGAEKQYA